MRRTLALLLGFAAAVTLRIAVGGPGVAQSALAGLVFAACLAGLTWAVRTPPALSWDALRTGVLGGAALCLPALIAHAAHGSVPVSASGYVPWAIVVTIVAVSEEYFLRGALFDAASSWAGPPAAVLIGAVAFAALHVPLYGARVIPLDLAVGVWLGMLRLVARSPSAPATAHVLADLAAWWLR